MTTTIIRDGKRPLQPHEIHMHESGEADFPGLTADEHGNLWCEAWVPVPCALDESGDECHRPDDLPEPGDRCTYCRWDLTWLGPGSSDYAATAPPEDADPAAPVDDRRWTVVALHDPDGEADDLADFRVMIAGVFRGHLDDHEDSVLAGGYYRQVEHVKADSAEEAAEIVTARIVGDEDDDDDEDDEDD